MASKLSIFAIYKKCPDISCLGVVVPAAQSARCPLHGRGEMRQSQSGGAECWGLSPAQSASPYAARRSAAAGCPRRAVGGGGQSEAGARLRRRGHRLRLDRDRARGRGSGGAGVREGTGLGPRPVPGLRGRVVTYGQERGISGTTGGTPPKSFPQMTGGTLGRPPSKRTPACDSALARLPVTSTAPMRFVSKRLSCIAVAVGPSKRLSRTT